MLKISKMPLNFPNCGFSAVNLAFSHECFVTGTKFSNSPKFRGGGHLQPPCHDATGTADQI